MAYSRKEKSSHKTRAQRIRDGIKKQRAKAAAARQKRMNQDTRNAVRAINASDGFKPGKSSKRLPAAQIKKNTAKSNAESKKRGQQTPTLPKTTTAAQRKYKAERLSAAIKKRTAAIKKKAAMKKVMQGGAGGKYDKNPEMPKAPKLPGGPKAKAKPSTTKPSTTTKSMKTKASSYTPATRSTPKPQTKQQKAYTKDQRNAEYDRLRKAGKTKEAEALGKKIAADARKKAPKNPYRAPQGTERKDQAYKNVQQLKAMRNFNEGKQISPERGRTFDVPVAKTEKKLKGRAA